MKRFFELLKDKGIGPEFVNILLGLIALASLVVFGITKSIFCIYVIIFIGAMMNIITGLSYVRRADKRNLGYCMVMLGVVIIVIFAVWTTLI